MNERRRTLLFSGGYEIPTAIGVYIETIGHKFYTVDEWDTSNNANVNSVAVITQYAPGRHEKNYGFRISNISYQSMPIDDTNSIRYETVLNVPQYIKADFSGKSNTEKMVSLNPNPQHAAGYCNAFIFPDGTTNGHLPATGELQAANEMINEIDAAFSACGGFTFGKNPYISSTLYNVEYINTDTLTCEFAMINVVNPNAFNIFPVDVSNFVSVRPFGSL